MPVTAHPDCGPTSKTLRTKAVSLLLAGWILLLAFHPSAWSEEATSREYVVKAAFLFSFAHFVAWPHMAGQPSPPASAPLRIGVLGDDPFGSALDETVRNEAIQGRKIIIARSHTIDDLIDCQILFICRSEEDRLAPILQHLENKPVLTISDMEDFAEHGGVIRLYVIGKKVRFEINQSAALSHQLKLDAQLLSLGRVIGPISDRSHP
jgi:hypothetical protein